MSKTIKFKAVLTDPDRTNIATMAVITDILGAPRAYEFSRTLNERETPVGQAMAIVQSMIREYDLEGTLAYGDIPQEEVDQESRLVLSIAVTLGEES